MLIFITRCENSEGEVVDQECNIILGEADEGHLDMLRVFSPESQERRNTSQYEPFTVAPEEWMFYLKQCENVDVIIDGVKLNLKKGHPQFNWTKETDSGKG